MDKIKFCKRCGRKLRSNASKERGYGITCYRRRGNPLKPLFSLADNND